MPQSFIVVGNKKIAAGLSWHPLHGLVSERKELDEICRRNDTKFGCVVRTKEGNVAGLYSGNKAGLPCGAAWLAAYAAKLSIVVVQQLDDTAGKVWLCAVRAGAPVPDYDLVLTADEAVSRLHDLIGISADVGDYKIFSTCADVITAFPAVEEIPFDELVGDINAPLIKQISGVPTKFIVPVIGIALLGAGWYGLNLYRDHQHNLEMAQQRAALTAEQARQDAAARTDAEASYRRAGAKLITDDVVSQPSMDTQIRAWTGSVEDFEISLAGWSLDHYECVAGACQVSWRRDEQIGTLEGFLAEADKRHWEVTNLAGNEAVVRTTVTAEARANTIDDLPPTTPFLIAFESQLQKLKAIGFGYELSRATNVSSIITERDASIKNAVQQFDLRPLPWSVGTVKVVGAQSFSVRSMPGLLSNPGLVIKKLKVDIAGKSWTMEMDYATR